MGDTPLILSLLFFFALMAFHLDNLGEFLTHAATWVVIVPLQLLEHLAYIAKDTKEAWAKSASYETISKPTPVRNQTYFCFAGPERGCLRSDNFLR
jgi:hypothetical protein